MTRRVIVGLVAGFALLSGMASVRPAFALAPPLPGEQIWAGGVSSYLYGINDTYDWANSNLENSPTGQQTLRSTGFTLLRSFFSEQQIGWPYPTPSGTQPDTSLDYRFSTIEKVGAQCLGVLAGSNSLAFDDHVLTYAETSHPGVDRCNLWEFHNEPTMDATYIADWNTKIAYLRAHHPDDKFIGPVISNPVMSQIQTFLNGVKASGVLPDAISWHEYACWASPDYTIAQASNCDSRINSSYTNFILQVKAAVRNTLGRDLPVGITEWNVSPNFVNCVNGQPPLTVDPNYQPHFIHEMFAAMKAGGLDFANEFDAMSGAGGGSCGGLDLLKSDGSGQPWTSTYATEISAARAGAPAPTPTPTPAPLPTPMPTPTSTSGATPMPTPTHAPTTTASPRPSMTATPHPSSTPTPSAASTSTPHPQGTSQPAATSQPSAGSKTTGTPAPPGVTALRPSDTAAPDSIATTPAQPDPSRVPLATILELLTASGIVLFVLKRLAA